VPDLNLLSKNLQGHAIPATPSFRKKFSVVTSGLTPGVCMPHFKSVALDVFQLVWNSLRDDLRDVTVNSVQFRRNLKTYLFA